MGWPARRCGCWNVSSGDFSCKAVAPGALCRAIPWSVRRSVSWKMGRPSFGGLFSPTCFLLLLCFCVLSWIVCSVCPPCLFPAPMSYSACTLPLLANAVFSLCVCTAFFESHQARGSDGRRGEGANPFGTREDVSVGQRGQMVRGEGAASHQRHHRGGGLQGRGLKNKACALISLPLAALVFSVENEYVSAPRPNFFEGLECRSTARLALPDGLPLSCD